MNMLILTAAGMRMSVAALFNLDTRTAALARTARALEFTFVFISFARPLALFVTLRMRFLASANIFSYHFGGDVVDGLSGLPGVSGVDPLRVK
jgi:hypothetical protein